MAGLQFPVSRLQLPLAHWVSSRQGALKQPVGCEHVKSPHGVAAHAPLASHVAWKHASIVDSDMHVPLGSTVPGSTG
jgi:hypothetical protein